MAMNKKERDAMEAALTQASLYSTQPVPFDMPPPAPGTRNAITQGYAFHVNLGAIFPFKVYEGWSESNAHGEGQYPTTVYRNGSQGARAMHSTRLLALRAARYNIEQQAKKVLRAIDREIEAEKAKAEERAKAVMTAAVGD